MGPTQPTLPSSRAPRALVTGGLGFIGSRLTERLLQEGQEVTVVDNVLVPRPDRLAMVKGAKDVHFFDCVGVDVVRGIRNGKFDAVYHLAAKPRVPWSVDRPRDSHRENLSKTVDLLEAVRLAPNKPKFVFASSSAVYGARTPSTRMTEDSATNPASPYALHKRCCEDYSRLYEQLYGINHASLRLFNVYGPGQVPDDAYSTVVCRWMEALKSKTKNLEMYGQGSVVRDFVYVGDVVDAFLAAGTKPDLTPTVYPDRRVWNVGSGTPVTIRDLLGRVMSLVPDTRCGVVWHNPRKGDVPWTLADTTAMETDLGIILERMTSLEDGLARTWRWWLGQSS